MNISNRLGLSILLAAITAGITGDILLKATPWGINVLIWVSGVIIAGLLIRKNNTDQRFTRHDLLMLSLLCFAGLIAWRDSTALKYLNIFGMIVTTSLILLNSQGDKIETSGIYQYVMSFLKSIGQGLTGGPTLVVEDIKWKDLPSTGLSTHLGAVIKGLVIAIPLLVIFGVLLSKADIAFSTELSRLFDWNISGLAGHIIFVVVVAWVMAGYLRYLFTSRDIITTGRPNYFWLGLIETVIVLGLLDLLFLSFVLIQFRYFFGGETRIQSITQLTYSEYAVSGFFELVWVAALVLVLLLAMHWLLKKDETRNERVFKILAGIQIVLVFVMIASALQRMKLYQKAYGLTELRVYTTAFMIWLAVIFLLFIVTVLRGKRERFAFGLVLTGFLAIIALNVINPDALIVRTNIERISKGQTFDAEYAAKLSADAIPDMINNLDKIDASQRCFPIRRLLLDQNLNSEAGWRRWNWSRWKAAELRIQKEETLKGETKALRCF